MKTLLTVLAIILILGGIWLIFFTDQVNNDTDNETSTTTEETTENDITDVTRFRTTLGGDYRLVMEYPENTTVTKINENVVEHKYIGPNSEPDTEITDGYYASIQLTEAADLEAYAEDQDPSSRIQTTTFAGHEALTYTVTSELGNEVTHIVYRPVTDTNAVINIGYTISGDSVAEYREILLNTLSSIIVMEIDDQAGGETETIQVAMLDYDGQGEESNGPERGCDRVVMIKETIPATNTPLNASLNKLFSYEDTTVEGWNNFIAKTNDTLTFDRATLENGVASVYLTGELSGLAGVCDNPRAKIQIEETALQFSTVNDVLIFLNGEKTDLQPDGRGE